MQRDCAASPRSSGPAYSDANVTNRDGRDFGWEIAHEAVSRRPPIFLHTMSLVTHMYTYAAKVWDLSIPLFTAVCGRRAVRGRRVVSPSTVLGRGCSPLRADETSTRCRAPPSAPTIQEYPLENRCMSTVELMYTLN